MLVTEKGLEGEDRSPWVERPTLRTTKGKHTLPMHFLRHKKPHELSHCLSQREILTGAEFGILRTPDTTPRQVASARPDVRQNLGEDVVGANDRTASPADGACPIPLFLWGWHRSTQETSQSSDGFQAPP